jgi:hypothetical protein
MYCRLAACGRLAIGPRTAGKRKTTLPPGAQQILHSLSGDSHPQRSAQEKIQIYKTKHYENKFSPWAMKMRGRGE